MAPRRLRDEDYTVGWVCALPIELAVAAEMLDEEHQDLPQHDNDTNLYTLGRIGEHNVVIACLPAGQIGTNSAAAVAVQMKSKFTSIRFGLMVGVGGGVPSDAADVRLGDVVISQPYMHHGGVVQYDIGKTTPSGFVRTGFLNTPPTILLNALAKLRANHLRHRSNLSLYLPTPNHLQEFARDKAGPDLLFESTYDHAGGPTCGRCSKDRLLERAARGSQEIKVHYGTIASSNQVIKDGLTRDRLSSELGGILCFEMEAAGLMNNLPCLVIRGICDYADSHKNKSWQPYAAATAAACAKKLLSVIPGAEVAKTCPVGNAIKGKEAPSGGHWLVPFDRNIHFVGRGSQLNELQTKLSAESHPWKVAIIGLGGVGKTQIALELAYRTRDQNPNCSVFWVAATNLGNVQQAYLDIGRQLQVPGLEEDKTDVKKLVQDRLSQESAGQWLLILDNADDVDMWFEKAGGNSESRRLIDYLPRSSKGSIVITTRSRKVAVKMASKEVIEVLEMDEDTATEVLRNALIQPGMLEDHQTTVELLTQLTFLPLAIMQAAAYINENGISISEYLSLFDDTEENIIMVLSEEFEDEGRYRDGKNPVATTWLISFEQIRRQDLLAAEYLCFMSCLDSKRIPQSLLPPAQSKKGGLDAIGTLTAYAFITWRPEDQSFDIHRLVHLATRNWLREEGSFTIWSGKALTRLADVFPGNHYRNREAWRAYLPHARYVLQCSFHEEHIRERLSLLDSYGLCLQSDGRYIEAEQPFVQVLEARKRALGREHPDTLSSIANLASTFRNQGRWKEAEELDVQVMETSKRVLGQEHPDTLNSIANLASTFWNQGRWKEAEELDVQVMETRKRVLGQEHPGTLRSMNNLASTIRKQGRWKEAEELQVQVMETSKRVLGQEHPDTLRSMNNLASTFWNQGRWKEAEELQVQVMETRRRVLGQEHPDTLRSMSNFALTFRSQGRWEEAEELQVKVTETRKRVLGQEHPDTLRSMNNLASTFQKQGRWKEAEELDVQVMETGKRVLGQDHPDTLSGIANLASTFQKQGRWKEAEELDVQVMETSKRVLGQEHPDTLSSIANLASTFRNQGRWKEAEELEVQVMETSKRVLGQEHPDTLTSMNNLAFTWKSQYRNHEALELMEKCFQLRKQKLGQDHPDTMSSLEALSGWLR